MAVPTVVAKNVSAFTSSNDPAFTLDAAPAAGDYIYVLATVTGGGFTEQAITGWTNLVGVTDTHLAVSDGTVGGVLIGHEVSGGEAGQTAWTLTDLWAQIETGEIAAICVNGGDLTTLIDGFGSDEQATVSTPFRLAATTVNTAGGTATTPTIDDGLVIRFLVKDIIGTFTTPADHTEQAAGNTNSALTIYTRDTAATASVDIASTNVTPSASDEFFSVTITVPPSGSTPPPPTATEAVVISLQRVI